MENTAPRLRTRDLTAIAACAALMAVCAWIAVPTQPPFTLQTLGVFLAVGVLGGRRGTAAVGLYLLMGAVGLPVFAGFGGGLGVLLGATGGYILGFLCSALLMWTMERLLGTRPPALLLSMALGLLVCYAFGTAWYMALYARTAGPIGLAGALGACVAPFIIPDLCKIAVALTLSLRLRRHVQQGR